MYKFGSICRDIFLLLNLFTLSLGLFEDQIGKFDWKQSYIGTIKFASFDSVKRIVIATEENVLASLLLKNGQIAWRHVFEDSATNSIELLHVNREAVTVSGDGHTWYIRGWDLNGGFSLWEWTMVTENKKNARWAVHKDQLLHIVPVIGSHLEVTSYQISTGQNRGSTSKISSPWISDLSRCVLADTYWACLSGADSSSQIFYINLAAATNKVFTHKVEHLIGQTTGSVKIISIKYPEPAFLLQRNGVSRLVILSEGTPKVLPYSLSSKLISIQNGDNTHLVEVTLNPENINTPLKIRSIQVEANSEETIESEYSNTLSTPTPVVGLCRGTACRLLLTSKDNAITLLQLPAGKVLWSREEALSNIVAVEFVELPVSEMDASIEHEFSSAPSDVLGMLLKRLSSQTRQLMSLVTGQQAGTSLGDLVRDEFGLHKLIIIATYTGKLYALDTLTGAITWTKYLENISPFNILGKSNMIFFEQRTARYSPLPAVCTLLAKDSSTGLGVLYRFDPISGKSENGLQRLPYRVKQAMLLPYDDEEHLKGLLILSEDNKVYLYPESANKILKDHAKKTFLYSADYDTGKLNGYSLAFSSEAQIKVTPIWEFTVKPSQLIDISVKPSLEKVHSQGRVLSDRSVLYKYVNPNLLAVATLTNDTLHKHVLSVYLVDGVTGFVVYSVSHKRASGPIHLVHSENWLVYTYFSERFRRMEVAAVELYEGAIQSNSTAFSSHAISSIPHVESQAYILPATPLAITATLTERGITSKHLLFALSNGAVIEIPWAFLEPRGPQTAAGPEEGYIPYIPELPLPSEAIINYNQSLARVKNMQVSPARLESTSLVLVYGLDLFYTRVTPSKTFDVLKEDFDHWLIIMVLGGLTLASYVTKQLASRKALKQAWK